MKTRESILRAALLALLSVTADLPAQDLDDRSRLYTRPDPSATGGIKGTVASPDMPIEQILAIPRDEMSFVYEGALTGTSRRDFVFENLPMRKYDLVVIYNDRFFDGVRLHRETSSLTAQDLRNIDASIQKSEPFFNHKTVHRVEGDTGRGNFARAMVTYLAAKKLADEKPRVKPHRRTFKLVLLKDVGPGWQIVKTRDLYPLSVFPNEGNPSHHVAPALSDIRVADSIKDLGQLHLTRSTN